MPYKDKEKQKEHNKAYCKKWYSKNREKELERHKQDRIKRCEWFKNYKSNYSCIICGESEPCAIDFHHIDETEKTKEVSVMVNDGYSIEKIIAEIEKCVSLCATCHRKVHGGIIKLK